MASRPQRLCLRSDPLDGLIMDLRQRAAVFDEEAHDLLQLVPILCARWGACQNDEPTVQVGLTAFLTDPPLA
jgi:hypothetical protein